MAQFRSPKVKNITLWREISAILRKKGFSVNPQELDRKFRNMKQRFKERIRNNANTTTGRGRLPEWTFHDQCAEIFKSDESVNMADHQVVESTIEVLDLSSGTQRYFT